MLLKEIVFSLFVPDNASSILKAEIFGNAVYPILPCRWLKQF